MIRIDGRRTSNMTDKTSTDLEQRIEAIESGYEFMLAYAAQGRSTDKGSAQGHDVREYLQKMTAAMDGLGEACAAAARTRHGETSGTYTDFLDAVSEDAAKARGVIQLVLACEDISSQLIDNMNTNVHLRALLTDLFVVDDALN